MGQPIIALPLGVILCKECGNMIDTLDTDRVMIFTMVCNHQECQEQSQLKCLEAQK